MRVLIFLTRNGERFSPSGGVIDREACWNGSELRCWQPSRGVQFRPGKWRNKNNTGRFPWNHWFFRTHGVSFSLSVLSSSSSSSSARLPASSSPPGLSPRPGPVSDFRQPSASSRKPSIAESEAFTPSFPEAF